MTREIFISLVSCLYDLIFKYLKKGIDNYIMLWYNKYIINKGVIGMNYNGYKIECFRNGYIVEYCGDEIYFDTIEEAKKFIDTL